MALVVLVLALMVAIAFVPDWTWPGRSRLREVLLGIACSIWVIGWFAAWKLGRPEPNERTWRAWWLRGSATLYLTFPFWWGLAPNPNPGGWLAVLLVALAAGVVAIPGYYRVLRQLAWRARSRFLPIHATLLSIFGILVFLVVVLLPDGHGSRDSLSMILGLPTMQIGSADNVRYALHMWHGSWPHPLELLILVFPVWAVAINVWMLALLVQTVRRADAATASALSGAARGGRSGSSSRP